MERVDVAVRLLGQLFEVDSTEQLLLQLAQEGDRERRLLGGLAGGLVERLGDHGKCAGEVEHGAGAFLHEQHVVGWPAWARIAGRGNQGVETADARSPGEVEGGLDVREMDRPQSLRCSTACDGVDQLVAEHVGRRARRRRSRTVVTVALSACGPIPKSSRRYSGLLTITVSLSSAAASRRTAADNVTSSSCGPRPDAGGTNSKHSSGHPATRP